MPVLSNPKHERFAQGLAAGKTADEAYTDAGYRAHRGNASTLRANQSIKDRIAELQDSAAARTEITVATLTEMYQRDREFAYEMKQPGAAIRAADSLAKLYGLFIDRRELSGRDGGPIQFDLSSLTDEELATLEPLLAAMARSGAGTDGKPN